MENTANKRELQFSSFQLKTTNRTITGSCTSPSALSSVCSWLNTYLIYLSRIIHNTFCSSLLCTAITATSLIVPYRSCILPLPYIEAIKTLLASTTNLAPQPPATTSATLVTVQIYIQRDFAALQRLLVYHLFVFILVPFSTVPYYIVLHNTSTIVNAHRTVRARNYTTP